MPIANEESLITYPTDFPIKVMGRKEGRFAHSVLTIVRKHAPDFDAATMELRPSPGHLPASAASVPPA
jgi:putative lipoic acid-binding regulatory protein